MNEEFSGGGQGAGAWENKGLGPLGRVWEMGEERACDGSLKVWKAGEKGGNYPAMLKICNRKMAK